MIKRKQNAHTLGPWYIIEYSGGMHKVVLSTKKTLRDYMKTPLQDQYESQVLGISEWINVKDQDLKLMSKAPEMLQALKDIYKEYKIEWVRELILKTGSDLNDSSIL